MLTVFGDSIVEGLGASDPSKCWVEKLSPVNKGKSAWQAADVANQILGISPDAGDGYAVAVGANDVFKYKGDAIKQGYFRQCLTAILAWLSSPVKTGTSMLTQSAGWHSAYYLVNSFGLASSTPGATLLGSVKGPKLYVGYTIQDHYLATGTAVVRVNGLDIGSFSSSGQGMTTHIGPSMNVTWGAACQVMETGLDDDEVGSVEIENTSAIGAYLYCDWIASAEQPRPAIFVGNVLERTAAAYAAFGLTAQMTADYNQIIENVLLDFPNAKLVDNHSLIDPLLHIADGVHPNDIGHGIIADNFKAACFQAM